MGIHTRARDFNAYARAIITRAHAYTRANVQFLHLDKVKIKCKLGKAGPEIER